MHYIEVRYGKKEKKKAHKFQYHGFILHNTIQVSEGVNRI